MKIVGVDPGLTGAMALLEDGKLQDLCPMPVLGKRVQGNQVADILRCWEPDVVVVEDIHAMPRGAIASFSLGWSCGVVVGVVQTLQYPLIRIRPNAWKKEMGLTGKSKDDSRLLATEMWPHWAERFRLKKDDGKAEAALIAQAHRQKENQ